MKLSLDTTKCCSISVIIIKNIKNKDSQIEHSDMMFELRVIS